MFYFVKISIMSILSTIGDALGNIAPVFPLIGAAADYISNSNTNQQNAKLAMYQNQWNLDMWNKQNMYNSPMAQMERLKAAGLNPNLVYGSGSAANQAGTVHKAEVPTLRAYQGGATTGADIVSAMVSNAQIKNLEEQNRLLRYDADLKKLEYARKGLELSGFEEDWQLERDMKRIARDSASTQLERDKVGYDIDKVNWIIKDNEADMSFIRKNITATEYEIIQAKLREQLATSDIREHENRDYQELGLRPTDPLWTRALANVLIEVVGRNKAKELFKRLLGQ